MSDEPVIHIHVNLNGREIARAVNDATRGQVQRAMADLASGEIAGGSGERKSSYSIDRLTDRGKRVLDLALREALASGHNYIGPEHIRAALDRLAEGGAS